MSECIICHEKLPRDIKVTGIHHESCPWDYYIECNKCGYQNNLSKLLGFGAGCSTQCKEKQKRIFLSQKIHGNREET